MLRSSPESGAFGRVLAEHLTDDLFAETVAGDAVARITGRNTWPPSIPVGVVQASIAIFTHAGIGAVRTRAVLYNQVHNAPASFTLLNVRERERRHLGSPEPAPEKDC